MRIVRNITLKNNNDKKLRIAYSICGEGHGHYGRNIEIINTLKKRMPACEITLYLYGDTWNIFTMDNDLPKDIIIKKIPGLRFIYKKSGVLKSLGSTISNLNNWAVVLRILKLDFLHTTIFPFRKLYAKIMKKTQTSLNRYYMKHFNDFDFAISDLEPLLPRIADVRKKPFITLDNQHSMLFCDINLKEFNFREKVELLFIRNTLKIYHPFSDLFILTCFFNLPINKKYSQTVKAVSPLVRSSIKDLKNKAVYEDFILVYAHKILIDKLLPIISQINSEKFVVFTKYEDLEENDLLYKRDWIEFHSINPHKFIDYLSRCKAVISTGGNTLISESVYLKKPFFAIGLEGNFEQRLNIYMLDKSDWGEGCKISDFKIDNLNNFINNIKKYQDQLKESNIKEGTDEIVNMIMKKIEETVLFS